MQRIPIRDNSRKNKPRILDYVCGDNGEEHIEYKVNQVVKELSYLILEGQIKAAKKVKKLSKTTEQESQKSYCKCQPQNVVLLESQNAGLLGSVR